MYVLEVMEVLERNHRVPREVLLLSVRAVLESAMADGVEDWRNLYEWAAKADAEYGPFPSPGEVARDLRVP